MNNSDFYYIDKLLDIFQDIREHSNLNYTPYLRSALPPISLSRINAYFNQHGYSFVIMPHKENHKVWLKLREVE